MRNEKLNFGVIIRVFISLIPLLLGMPSLSGVMCAYNILMSFVVFGTLSAFVSSLSAVLIAILIGQFYGNAGAYSGLTTALQAVFCSLGTIYGYLLKRKFSHGLMLGTIGVLIPQFLFIKSQATRLGVSIAQSIVPEVESIKGLLSETLSQVQPIITETQIHEIAVYTNKFTTMFIPSAFIITSLVLAYVVIWTVSVPLSKLNIGLNHSFACIKAPKTMVVVFGMLIVFFLATIGVSLNQYLTVSLFNMLVILSFICFSAGLSTVEFFLRKLIKFTPLRVIFHTTVLFVFPIISLIYIIIACIDSFANFRKLENINHMAKKGENNETEKRNA